MPNESPNGFTARVYDPLNQEWRPIYQAPDATNTVQGDVFLSDAVDSTLNAATGMTAATPAAVKAANDNANTKIPNTAGSVTNTNLAANSVTSDKIKDGTIVNADIANGTITGSKITNNTITTNHIQDGTITNDDIAPGTIKGDRISNSTISSSHIIDGTIELNDLSTNLQNIIQNAGQINLTANRAVITNSNGNGFETSRTTSTELSYLSGVTSSVQTQLNNKAALNHTHNYAGSSSAGGAANSVANALTISLNGTSQGAYNGSAAKSINITASSIGAATSGHVHAAGDITSGTLAVGRGGTGITANPSMLINLSSTSAASVFAASPRPGITGTLDISHGGTGATARGGSNSSTGLLYKIGLMSGTANPSGSAANGCVYIKYSS